MILLLVALTTEASARAVFAPGSPCEPNLRPIKGELGYQPRGVERCEGLYEAPTSAAFDVLSFARVPVTDSGPDATIGVLLPRLPEKPGSDVRIQVKALREKTYYQLDTHGGPASAVSWSTRTVLDKAGLTMKELGYLGWVRGNGGKLFVPLSVFQGAPPASAPAAPLTLVVRSSLRFEWVKWRIRPPSTRGTAAADWHELEGDFPPGEPLEIILPPGLAGVWTLDVYGQPVDRDIPEHITLHVLL